MSKLSNILSGWKNFIWKSVEVERLATKRATICSGCPNAVEGSFEIIKDNEIKEISGMVCNMCLCPLSAKLRSPEESCPKKKW